MRRLLLGGVLLLAGAALILSALWPIEDAWRVERTPLTPPEDLTSYYPLLNFERLEIKHAQGQQLTLYLVRYQDKEGIFRQALLPEPGSAKWRAWMELGQLLRNLERDALVIAWWDNGQRVDFLSGLATWIRQPPKAAFASEERPLWQTLSGGFEDSERSIQLVKWWTADSVQALSEIARLKFDRPVYFLVSSDDLTHLDEIERLAGKALPLEVRIFPEASNFHAQIAQIKRWARETGKAYLPLKVPGGIAAWRLTQESPPFLLSLLPFLPLSDKAESRPWYSLTQVYQSLGGYLTLYRR